MKLFYKMKCGDRVSRVQLSSLAGQSKKWFAIVTLPLLMMSPYIGAESVKTAPSTDAHVISQALHALFQGDDASAKVLIENEATAHTRAFDELEILYQLEKRNIDTVIQRLEQYESRYRTLPEAFDFSAQIWRSVGHEVNIFSKRGYYKRALAAKSKTGLLAPHSPYFLTLRASAIGQDDDLAREDESQLSVTNKITSMDKKWGFISRINYAQSTGNKSSGKKLSENAALEYKQDFEIQERIAQYYWTIGQKEQAQQHFLIACHNPPAPSWHNNIMWFNSCYQVAYFSQQYSINIDAGIKALNTLLNHYRLPTRNNFDLAVMLLDLSQKHTATQALALLKRIIEESDEPELVKQAVAILHKRE